MAALGDILKVTAFLTVGVDVTMLNVFHVRIDEEGDTGDEEVVEDLAEWVDDIYSETQPITVNDLAYDYIDFKNITANVDLGTSAFPTLTVGNSAAEMLPHGVSGLSLARTSTPGHHGRKFWGGLHEGGNVDGLWGSTPLAAMSDAAVVAYSPFESTNGNAYTPVIVDRETGQGRLPVVVQTTNLPAYQRRRKPGVGI